MRDRGQNLVLMALSMLLLTLMVLGTLGLSQRLRENHELQNVADAAAYSSAVQNARAFNNIAILNRVQVSLWVAQAADQSLISWAAYARASLNASVRLLGALRGTAATTSVTVINPATGLPVTTFPCAGLGNNAAAAQAMLQAELDDVRSDWQAYDVPAGTESRNIQLLISAIRHETRSGGGANCYSGRGGVCGDLFDERDTQAIAQRVVQNANLDGVVVHTGGRSSSRRELDCGASTIIDPPAGSGLCIGGWSDNMLEAAMGSRGNPFVTSRGVISPRVARALAAVTAAYPEFSWSDSTPTGSGYWSSSWASPTHGSSLGSLAAWGDDHGALGLTGSNATCAAITPPAEQIRSHVKSTQLTNTQDEHEWTPNQNDNTPPETVHTMGDCTPYCPSVWVSAVGFRPNQNDRDAWGQPKVTVLLERDTTVLPRPWELNFKLRFAAAGAMPEFDNRAHFLHGAFAGTDIHLAYGFATGVTYYHRKDHWVETPNLLNPYWRATLVSSDFDHEGRVGLLNNDVEAMLPNWRGQAYRELVNAGFRGFQ